MRPTISSRWQVFFVAGSIISGTLVQDSMLKLGACGLQNGMVSTYSGAVLRTTHVSGAFTDLGIFIGQRLRGLTVDIRRIGLCVMLVVGFLFGSLVGAAGYVRFEYDTLYFPALSTGGFGVAYAIYRHRRRSSA